MRLIEPAIIKIALHRPMVGHGVAAVERNQSRLVFGGLRPGVNRAIVVGEQLDRCRSNHAEVVVCCGRDEMNLGIGALPAEIAHHAAPPRVSTSVLMGTLAAKKLLFLNVRCERLLGTSSGEK